MLLRRNVKIKTSNPMATRTTNLENPLITIWNNTEVLWLYVCYYFARFLRPLFHLSKPPFTVNEYINSKRNIVEIITAEV